MAVPSSLNKRYQNFGGLNLRVSDLLRPNTDATDIDNATLRKTGALSKRKGKHTKTRTKGGYGTVVYPNRDIDSGDITEELLTMDDKLWKLTEDSFTVTYTGPDEAYYDFYLHTDGDFYFEVYEDNMQILSENVGNGKELSFVTIDTLCIAIAALTNFTCPSPTIATEPAAFLQPILNASISSSGRDVDFEYYLQVDTPNGISAPFIEHYATRIDDNFENASAITTSDVLYISNGYDEMHKYDSLRVYRAGIPSPTTAPGTNLVGGSLTGTHKYKYVYRYTDAKGNPVTGNASPEVSVSPSSQDVEVTVNNILDTSGFNTDQAIVNGNQVGVNIITVTSGHNIKVDDKVYFLDSSSGDYVTRNVTAIAATTITVDGATVDVNTSEIINPQLEVVILRTKDTGSLFYEVVGLVNDSANATQTYTDATSDSSLIIEYIPPIFGKEHDLPPKGKYMATWRNNICITGILAESNVVRYSDLENVEYFPSFGNSYITEGRTPNKGIRALDNALYIFQKDSITITTGDLNVDSFQVDKASDSGIGTIAHATIKEINNEIWFLSPFGLYSISSKGLEKRSQKIDPVFNKPNAFNLVQATAFHWVDEEQYVITLPVVETSGSVKYFGNTTRTFVYDTHWNAWLEWSAWNMASGMVEYNNQIYIHGRDVDSANSELNYTCRIHDQGTGQDYNDHDESISFTYKTHWETAGEPNIWKKFLRIKVDSLDASLNNFESEGFVLDIITEHDYRSSAESILSLDFTGGAEGWGNSAWSEFPWGENRLPSLKSKLASKKAKAVRVTFENDTASKNVLISGYTLEIKAPYDLTIKE